MVSTRSYVDTLKFMKSCKGIVTYKSLGTSGVGGLFKLFVAEIYAQLLSL
jgi:hypothetical protein